MGTQPGVNVANSHDQGGSAWHVNGTLDIESGGIETVKSGGVMNVAAGGALQVAGVDKTAAIAAATATPVAGVAAGYKIARGEHTQVAASDTVVTGLATVISVVVSPRTRTVKQLFFDASPGDQAGTPASGSVLILSKKPTAVNDVTPIAATDFTDNIVVDWIAVGT